MSAPASTPASSCKHIDRKLLYTDTKYRFDYVAEFANFGDADIEAIRASAPIIKPLIPVIVDAVYDKLFSFDITKQVFLNRNEGFTGSLASDLNHLTVKDGQIGFRKEFLTKYLHKLTTFPSTPSFLTYLNHVGRIHTTTPTKKSTINVDYIHINALFAFLHGLIAETVDAHPELQQDKEKRAKVLAAWSKLLWIQNDLFARWYVKDGEEYGDEVDGEGRGSG
ncbi:hypothetical protein HK104_004677, partial [Borealophlyctis nickersoniae]